jgi:predicted permease
MGIFINVVVPVFIIFLAGFGIQKWKKLNIKSASTVAIYILSPCLVFRTFYETELNGQYTGMVFFTLALLVLIIIINKIVASFKRYPQSVESGLILSTAFMNSGNYGVPIVLFAYGEAGFDYAVSFMVLQAIVMNFFGVYYAVKGQSGIRLAVRSVLQMPNTYATILALGINLLDIRLSVSIISAVDLVAEAAIPLVMIILGMQLAEISVKSLQWSKISYGVVMRLLISPIIAVALLQFIELDPLLQKVLILLAAMPSAATANMYAVQFNAEPKYVSSVTLFSTLFSIVTITALLMMLG